MPVRNSQRGLRTWGCHACPLPATSLRDGGRVEAVHGWVGQGCGCTPGAPGLETPSLDPRVGTSEPPALAQPRGEGSAPVQPSSASRSRSQPVSGINISCAQAVHLTLFHSSAPELCARSSGFSPAPPSCHRRWGAPPAPQELSLSLPAGCWKRMGMEQPWLQVFRGDLAVSSPVWGGRSGWGREPAAGARLCAAL